MRRFLLLAPLLLLSLAASCGGSSPRAPSAARAPATPTPAAPVTISWSFWGDPQEVSINNRIVQLFEKEHPEIQVETRWAAYGDYLKQLDTWRKQGDVPDVSFLYDIPVFAGQGQLTDLTPMMHASSYDLGDFYLALLDQFRYQGDLYGLPRDNDTKVLYFNKDLFDAAGVPYPKAGWSWSDLRTTALALKQASGGRYYPFAFEPQGWWKLWVWQNGGSVFDNQVSPSRLTLDSPAAIEALRFERDLIYADGVTPPRETMRSSAGISDLFVQGKLAIAFGNHALVPLFAGTGGLHWGVAGLPQQVRQANYAGGAGYVINAGSKHKDAAWTFLTWLEGTKGEAIFTESGLIVPSRRSVGASNLFLHQAVPQSGSTNDAVQAGNVFLSETEHGIGQPAFPGSTAIMEAIDDGLEPIWSEGADPESVVAALTPRINAMLGGRH